MLKIINFQDFTRKVKKFKIRFPRDDHWDVSRWSYYEDVVNLILSSNLRYATKVLEIGPMGIPIFDSSETMDWKVPEANWPIDSPTYVHNGKRTPWPFRDNQFDLVIALRVFQHLSPFQREAFLEAERISRNLIIVVPAVYPENTIGSKAITLSEFIQFQGQMNLIWYNKRAQGQLLLFSEAPHLDQL